MKQNTLASRLDVWGFDDDIIVYNDGSVGFAVSLSLIDITSWQSEDINGYVSSLRLFLNGLPQDLYIQFVLSCDPLSSKILDTHLALSDAGAMPLATRLCQSRIEQLRAAQSAPEYKLQLFVRKPPSGTIGRKWFSFKPRQAELLVSQQDLASVKLLRSEIVGTLAGLQLSPQPLQPAAICDDIYRLWNPDRKIGRPEFSPDDIRNGLLFTDAVISDLGFSLGGVKHRVLSLKLLPECSFASMAARLSELPFASKVFLSVYVPDQRKEISVLQSQRRLAFSLVQGKRSGVRDIDSEAKFADLESLLENMVAQGEKVFHFSLNILVTAPSDQELEARVSAAMLMLRDLGGAEAMQESYAAFDVFSQMAIPNARSVERYRRIKTTNLADFLPCYGPWHGHQRPSILLKSRWGSVIKFDPFDMNLANANQVVSGGSGSGKSFLCNILTLHLLKEAPRIFIVDIGGSYKKMCELLHGQYVSLAAGGDHAINPFDFLANNGDGVGTKFLVDLVDQMTREDSASRLPKFERAVLEDVIVTLRASCPSPTITRLRECLLAHQEPSIKRLGTILSTWCGNSVYGKFVDRPTSIKLDSPVVCFDLKGMESHPDLQAVSLLLIMSFIWSEVERDRQCKKFVLFDECWKLLENPAGASFIGEVFRTFRKYHASAIAISQNIDDFAKSTVATAILPNSAIKWILSQKGADRERLKSVLQLNTKEMELVDSLEQKKGVYSEAYLIAQDSRAVVAVESTPLEYWIATTDPRELAEIERRRESGKGLGLATIEQLAQEYPRGLTNS